MFNLFVNTLRYIALSSAIALVGCASLDEEECLNANWHMIGIEDGSYGRPLTTLARHRKACAKVGVVPDQRAYDKGHREGLVRYCTFQNGVRLGEQGKNILIDCPAEAGTDFKEGFEQGHAIYQAQQHVRSLEANLKELLTEFDTLVDSIDSKKAFLVSAEGDAESRKAALEELESLKVDLQLLDNEIHNLENELVWEKDRLESLRNHVRFK